ncbi:hypothetical protein SASPL_100740 [Salvia splendens]|uniref:Uncharacterized protein n=1 Tax=Salvia splendens TaxID=180675 RepID=A0A8X8YPN0_SALSN|nr:hypothetical protein SASPL_100740 [Salvia splendens]
METSTGNALIILSPNPRTHTDFNSSFNHLSTLISSSPSYSHSPNPTAATRKRVSPAAHALLKNLSTLERALIGASSGGIAGAFSYVCLHPLDTVKTKLQTKGASEIYKGAFDVIVKTFQSKGILGFYSGVSAVIVGSTFSSAVYFGTCEFGKSFLSKCGSFPPLFDVGTSRRDDEYHSFEFNTSGREVDEPLDVPNVICGGSDGSIIQNQIQ